MVSGRGQKILLLGGLLLVLSGLSLFFDREQDLRISSEVSSDSQLVNPTDRVVAASEVSQQESLQQETLLPETHPDVPVKTELASERSEIFSEARWRAVQGLQAFSPAQMYQLGFSKQKAKAQVNGFYLFASEGVGSQERAFIPGQPMVLKNERTGDLGVVTGNLQITLKDNAALEVLLKSYRLKVIDAFPHLRTYMVSSLVSPFDLVDLFQRLSRDSEIISVEVENLTRDFKSNRGQR